MLFPLVINDIEQHAFLELANDFLRLGLSRFLEVHGDIIDFLAIGNRDKDILVHRTLVLIHFLDNRVGDCHEFIHTTLEGVDSSLSEQFAQFLFAGSAESVLVKRHFDSKDLHRVELQHLVIHRIACVGHDRLGRVVNHVRYIHTDTLTVQRVTTFSVDDVTLLVHDIVVLNQTLTDTKVILLDFLLCALNRIGDHLVLNHLTFLEAHTVHDRRNTFRAEHTHQIILQRDIEDGTTRVTLTSGTSAQLSIYTA